VSGSRGRIFAVGEKRKRKRRSRGGKEGRRCTEAASFDVAQETAVIKRHAILALDPADPHLTLPADASARAGRSFPPRDIFPRILRGSREVNESCASSRPLFKNRCYALVNIRRVISVSRVYRACSRCKRDAGDAGVPGSVEGAIRGER